MKTRQQLKDYLGRSVKRRELDEDQTSRIQGINREFAEHPSRGLTPARLASILSNAEQGSLIDQCDLFEDMEEKDAHIFTELSKRKRALLGLDWHFKAPKNASKAEENAAEQLTEWFEDIDDFEDLLLNMADGIGKAFSMHSIEWRQVGSLRLPIMHHKPPRWFTVDPEEQDKLMLRTNDGKNEDLWPFAWVKHVHKAKSGYVARGGLHRILAWPFLFKNYSVRDLAEFLEIYGIPARLGTYPRGATDNEKLTLLRAVTSIGHNAAGIIPEGMMMDFKDAAKGSGDAFKIMIDWCEASVSKAVLGGTLTTTAQATGLGSGLGDVHNEVRRDLLVSDARQIASTFNRDLAWPMCALNIQGIDPRRMPKFVFETEEAEDMQQMSEALPKLVDIGMKIPATWAHKKMQIPKAEEGEDVLSVIVAPATPPAPKLAAAKANGSGSGETLDEIEQFGEQLLKEGQPVIDNMIDTVKQLLDESIEKGHTMQQFQNRLLSIYGDMDPAELASVMQLGLAAADLAGRFDINEKN